MSQHPSLRVSHIGSQHRNVVKRYERIKFMLEKDRLKQDSSMFGLPKIKRIRLKVKKEKAEETAKTTQASAPAGITETKPNEKDQGRPQR